MKNLYIDFDGVICDTIGITYDMMEKSGTNYTDEMECMKFYENLDWNYILENSHIINDAMGCIQQIIDSGRFDVAILTHVNSINEIICKVNFIRKYFTDLTIIPVPKAISKTKMINSMGSILVDDYNGNLEEWTSEGGLAVRFDLNLDSKGFLVIDKLSDILTLF